MEATKSERKCIVFIGNPGAGKSTLVNSIVGSRVVESGVNSVGLTKSNQYVIRDGIEYIDTPGLADTKVRNQAAQEIENALRLDCNYHIIFVLTLEGGRIKPEDCKTINRVLWAIKRDKKIFSVIINKVRSSEKREIFDIDQQFQILKKQINSGWHKTDNIFYIEYDRNIEDEFAEFITIDERTKRFLHDESHFFFIGDFWNVTKIITSDVQEFKLIAKKEQAALELDLEAQRRQAEKLQQQLMEQEMKLYREQQRLREQRRLREKKEIADREKERAAGLRINPLDPRYRDPYGLHGFIAIGWSLSNISFH